MKREASALSEGKLLGNGENFGYQAYDASIVGGALLLFWLRALLRQHGTESRIYPGPRPSNELGKTHRGGGGGEADAADQGRTPHCLWAFLGMLGVRTSFLFMSALSFFL